jgi:hypothetical protein
MNNQYALHKCSAVDKACFNLLFALRVGSEKSVWKRAGDGKGIIVHWLC